MRKSVRLTGRRQLAQSSFDMHITDRGESQSVSLVVIDPSVLHGFPANSSLKLKLAENKRIEVLDFGTIATRQAKVELDGEPFLAPSCQIRIVNRASDQDGLLLGSTSSFTYKSDGETDGILLFQPADTAPRSWRLDISDSSRPILYIDKKLPNPAYFARTDPTFITSVFPHVITEVFRRILETGAVEDGWEAEWVTWADSLMKGSKPPFNDDEQSKAKWIGALIDTFCSRHDLAGKLLRDQQVRALEKKQ